MCVCQSFCSQGRGKVPHVTITYDTLDVTIQGPPPQFPWTYSNLFIMKYVRLASGRLASYWNTSFFRNVFDGYLVFKVFSEVIICFVIEQI